MARRLAEFGEGMNVKQLLAVVALAIVVLGCAAPVAGEGATHSTEIATISVQDLHKRLQARDDTPLVVDVREPAEYDAIHIDGVRLAPLGTVPGSLKDVKKDQEIVLVCRSGRRSAKAYRLLEAQGFTRLKNLEGGMLAWEKQGLPAVKK